MLFLVVVADIHDMCTSHTPLLQEIHNPCPSAIFYFSSQTIFYSFPRLSELSDDEWIPPWKFEKMAVFSADSSLPVRNPVPDLSQMHPGDWIQQDKGTASGWQQRA